MKLRAAVAVMTVTGALALLSGAALAESGLEAKSGETVFFRGWQYKTDIVQGQRTGTMSTATTASRRATSTTRRLPATTRRSWSRT